MNEAELLFSELLGLNRFSLYQRRSLKLGRTIGRISSLILRSRASGAPLQYTLGKVEFMGLEFKVTPSVFIPRPETEILVEQTLQIIRRFLNAQIHKPKILDLGTGSGCIAVSLAKVFPNLDIDAVDISQEALAVARENAMLNKAQVNFFKSDLFSSWRLTDARYDIIVSNPPYITRDQIRNLQPEIQYEPVIALDGGGDGLDLYRRISAEGLNHLVEHGMLILEIGYGQSKSVENILQERNFFEIIEIVKDYNNIERVIIAKRLGQDG
ncbi:MAG: peptide chain release factor N(5)-glutamine methyltransferase [Candidatus Omnitrophica bacterium]|nr:peptide chain release factor N(5)-glutamine methyltransferase [Candidatus Omnitrophota bacterium]